MRFSEIPGHDDVKERLRQLADGSRIPHALLLEGPAGIGKFALARAFMQYVGCTQRKDGDSCGVCPSCRQHQINQHIDTLFSFPYIKRKSGSKDSPTLSSDYLSDFIEFLNESPFMDIDIWLEKLGRPNTKPQIYVEEAVELIRRLSMASHSSRYNSVIMWKVDRLVEAAANKLLKLIEEPPGEAIIIMTSDEPMNILPTIYSRAQRIKVSRYPDDMVAGWMIDSCGTPPESAASLAPLARGSLSEALRLLEHKNDSDRFLEYFKSLMRLAYKRDIAALKEWSQKVGAEKRDTAVAFLEYMARMIRENFIANFNNASLNLMTVAESEFSQNFARFINEKNVEEIFNAIGEAISDIRANVNVKIVLFDLAITVILKLKQ